MPTEVVSTAVVHIHAMTDVGKSRSLNEDNFIVCPDLEEKRWFLSEKPAPLSSKGCLLVVADGMGGANAGEVASQIAVETIQDMFDALLLEESMDDNQVQDYLYQAILAAHKAILKAAEENPEFTGMGTTVLLAWVFSDKATIAWVGDSRAYIYGRKEGLQLLSKDHSLVWELVEAGKLTAEEADVHPDNNIITQSLGDRNRSPRPEFVRCKLRKNDRLLLCSDGLNNLINHKTIGEIVGQPLPLAVVNQQLIQAANNEGGTDNITVLLLEVLKAQSGSQKPKNKKIGWLLVALILVLAGSLIYYGKTTGSFLQGRFILNEQLVEEPAKSQPSGTSPVSASSAISESVFFSGQEKEMEILVNKYRYLDSMFCLRFPERKLDGLGRYNNNSLFAATQTDSEVVEQEKKEFLHLAQKYQLGFPEGQTFHPLKGQFPEVNSPPGLESTLLELEKIEVLLNKLKPD